jgi:Tfp pilus assembly protein PilO
VNRIAVLLTALGLVLVVALFYVALFQPAREELADVEAQIAEQEVQQQRHREEIERLRLVRDEAPETEADLVAAERIVPRDPQMPALIRQLQVAANESGIDLQTVSASRPTELADAPQEGLAAIPVQAQLAGGYFQVVDFLRRIEDPTITSRGITWTEVNVVRGEAYPALEFQLSGRAFAIITEPLAPEPEPEASDAETSEGDEETTS